MPKMPRIMDVKEYEEKKKKQADEEQNFMEMKKGQGLLVTLRLSKIT